MWEDKMQACDCLEDLNFQKLYGNDVGLEVPLSFINSFMLMFLENLRPEICVAVSVVSSYLVEPH